MIVSYSDPLSKEEVAAKVALDHHPLPPPSQIRQARLSGPFSKEAALPLLAAVAMVDPQNRFASSSEQDRTDSTARDPQRDKYGNIRERCHIYIYTDIKQLLI